MSAPLWFPPHHALVQCEICSDRRGAEPKCVELLTDRDWVTATMAHGHPNGTIDEKE